MDKNAIKKYAVWARRELIERVSQRAMIYGITAKDAGNPNDESVNGHLLSQAEKRQRQALIRNIKTKGYEQVMEEVAYTWFNRFAALRFMEVNGYLPSHIRVFTNDAGEFKPQILAEAIHLELDGLDMNKVYEMESANKSEELFKYLLIVQCNALNSILPGMFQRIEDYTELLLPDYLLREGSVIEQMVTTIPEEDWTDQVQIIGWLYQYYNTELFDAIFNGVDQKKSLKATELPAATQLFTPDWAIQYMVANSLGKLWIEGHPNEALKAEWKYYLDRSDNSDSYAYQLESAREQYKKLRPDDILIIDPCMGSGHILCVLFDMLIRIYEEYGFTAREATAKIVENNLWGLDIDERAAQLAYFAIMMKARQYDRRFFSRGIQPNVYSIKESNNLDLDSIQYFTNGRSELISSMNRIIDGLHDANEYGSILHLPDIDFNLLFSRFTEIENESMPSLYSQYVLTTLLPFVKVAKAMAQTYHVIVTNPPYLNGSRMNSKLTDYVLANYEEGKADFATVMYLAMERHYLKKNGFISFITTNSWMFLKSFVKTRAEVIETLTFDTIVDYGTELFDGKIGHLPIVAWTARKTAYNGNIVAIRLVEFCYSRRDEKYEEFFNPKNRYFIQQESFRSIEGAPIVYWMSENVLKTFKEAPKLLEYARPRVGQNTGDNNRFLRYWYELEYSAIGFGVLHEELATSPYKWIPYNKGGNFRRWYGNFDYVVNWENDGKEIKDYAVVRNKGKHWSRYIQNIENMCKPGISWSDIATTRFGCRLLPTGFICDVKGSSMFPDESIRYYLLAFLNSKIAIMFLQMLNPTTTFQVGNISTLPLVVGDVAEVTKLTQENIGYSKADWDSFEVSWDFKRHPLIRKTGLIKQAFELWDQECANRWGRLKRNEEAINDILIRTYGLQDELTPEVDDRDITVREADRIRDIKSFISYAVGCMFGRYSLDYDGLAYAGGDWDSSKYITYIPDRDGIIPICDDEYFEDDILGRFITFVEVVFGHETLEENLGYISEALGGKGTPREVIRNYFINGFYSDHIKIYQKRPIYWLFDSGKKNGFKCLVYVHRYQPDTIARIRTDYVHEQQSRYRTAIDDFEQRIQEANASERVKYNKRLLTLQTQADELRGYEEKIHHLADQMIRLNLDDGVVENYRKLQSVLAAIK